MPPNKHPKLRLETDLSAARREKLRFGKAKHQEEPLLSRPRRQKKTIVPTGTQRMPVYPSSLVLKQTDLSAQQQEHPQQQSQSLSQVSAEHADHTVYAQKVNDHRPPKTAVSAVHKKNPKLHQKIHQATAAPKLRFDREERSGNAVKSVLGEKLPVFVSNLAAAGAHQLIAEHEEDNVGVQSAHETEQTAETLIHSAANGQYSQKLKKSTQAEQLSASSDRTANSGQFRYQRKKEEYASNPLSRWYQRQAIKKEYAASRAGKAGQAASGHAAEKTSQTTKKAGDLVQKLTEFCASHKRILLIILIGVLVVMAVSGMFSSCSAMWSSSGQIVLATSFTAEDEDILGTEEDYKELESKLRDKIANIETTNPGYDEYRYFLDEIGHDPYVLASYLTVVYEDYTRGEVQGELARLLEEQYELKLETVIEQRSVTTTNPDGTTTTTYYDYKILNVTLINHTLEAVVDGLMDADQKERYEVLLEMKGNRPYLFGDDNYLSPGDDTGEAGESVDYDIPGEALTDTAFANMIKEAEKYLDYPYVWGGSSPSTSFDCSGFVSWVINNCGNGWDVGRLTANGLKNYCEPVSSSEAKPGDLIFFEGTYDTVGASHVGIYVGNNMMIHCGDPISYTRIDTNYWKQHFYGFGRIP